jgi:IS66 Orf2 like protein
MADPFDSSKTAPRKRLRSAQRHRAARPVVISTAICVGALLIVASLFYECVFAPRRAEPAPTWANGSQIDAVQVWKDQTAMLGRMRVSRMMADNRKESDDAQGFALWYRRLEVGTFRFPIAAEGTTSLAISATDLAMLLDGMGLDENACGLVFDPRREGAKRERDRSDS